MNLRKCLPVLRTRSYPLQDPKCRPCRGFLFERKRTEHGEIRKLSELLRVLQIESDIMPLAASFAFARIGNYIDFGAMNQVDGSTFMDLLSSAGASEADLPVLESFIRECRSANRFLLIADNCGEIVLDKLFLEQVKKHMP